MRGGRDEGREGMEERGHGGKEEGSREEGRDQEKEEGKEEDERDDGSSSYQDHQLLSLISLSSCHQHEQTP